MKNAADVIRVIGDVEMPADQIGNQRACPAVVGVPEALGAFEKHVYEQLSVVEGQIGRASWDGPRCKAIDSSITIGCQPAMDRTTIDVQLSCYLAGTEAIVEKSYSFQSPLLKGSLISEWSHVLAPKRSMRHYLCGCHEIVVKKKLTFE